MGIRKRDIYQWKMLVSDTTRDECHMIKEQTRLIYLNKIYSDHGIKQTVTFYRWYGGGDILFDDMS